MASFPCCECGGSFEDGELEYDDDIGGDVCAECLSRDRAERAALAHDDGPTLERKAIATRDEAQDFAVEWQQWQADRDLSYGELMEWASYFAELGERFDLTEEFTENGIL